MTSVSVKLGKQAVDCALCESCEQLLNSRGEKWVEQHCWHSATDFPLYAIISRARGTRAASDELAYRGSGIPEIDLGALIHFAAGVFWRASAMSWRVGQGAIVGRLNLGPYEEPLRSFVLDQAPLPNSMALHVHVSTTDALIGNAAIVVPIDWSREATHRQFRFAVPGLVFDLYVGKALPLAVRQSCIVHGAGNPILSAPSIDMTLQDGLVRMISRTKPRGSFKR
jgi:hypothetical protein